MPISTSWPLYDTSSVVGIVINFKIIILFTTTEDIFFFRTLGCMNIVFLPRADLTKKHNIHTFKVQIMLKSPYVTVIFLLAAWMYYKYTASSTFALVIFV
jgi:hypothetical protein